MLLLYVITVFAWLAGCLAAPPSCENLLRPNNQLIADDLEGRWNLVSASVSNPEHLEKLKLRDSAVIIFGYINGSSEMSFRRIFSIEETCQYYHGNISVNASGFSIPQSNISVVVFLTSCPDCLVMKFSDQSGQVLRLYVFSRRRQVEPTEMVEFKSQVECLNMMEPVHMDPSKELCPDQVVS